MTKIIETSEFLCIDRIRFGNRYQLLDLMSRAEYNCLEAWQIDSSYNRLYSNDTLDDRSIVILAFGN
jgi:hypothetical protein